MAAMPNRIEPVPRRLRGYLNDHQVFDTTAAKYCWEVPYYPQYYIPLDDIDDSLLVDEERQEKRPQGLAHRFGLRSGDETRHGAVRVYHDDALRGLEGTARFAGRRWTRGTRKMSRSSSTRGARTCAPMRCARLARYGWAGRGSAGGGTDDGHGV